MVYEWVAEMEQRKVHRESRQDGADQLCDLTAMPAVVVRQRKAWRRRDGVFLYFEVCV